MLGAVALLGGTAVPAGETDLPDAKPVPAVQVLPLPYDQASFTLDGRELTRYHFGQSLRRPFWYPIVGPGGRSLTRMGHPHAPYSHRHHYSVWISHNDVDGVSFWTDNGPARIICQRVEEYTDGDKEASMLSLNAWQTEPGKTVMLDRRRTTVRLLGSQGWLMAIDLELQAPPGKPVTLGATPFGLIGVRMAKTIGAHDGGGRILNSEGQINEAGVFRKPARWVDYSGPVTNKSTGGIALLDHPQNPGHPTPFHVRDDGWMGICLTLEKAMVIKPGTPLRLRYALWVHDGVPGRPQVDKVWKAFAASKAPAMEKQRP